MNIDVEQIFAEIGKLHMQIALLTSELAKAQADLERKKSEAEPVCST
jgi:uncharacterized small protein (DUF1192 family)